MSIDWALQEVHARLVKLYPQYRIAHMPSSLIQPPPGVPQTCCGDTQSMPSRVAANSGADGREACAAGAGHGGGSAGTADCDEFVANAAVAGDAFGWHIDADPLGLGPSPWTEAHGTYCNGVSTWPWPPASCQFD